MEEINLGRVQGLTTSITINGNVKTQTDGNIDIGQITTPDVTGELANLKTGTNESLVAAINEINDKAEFDPGIPPGTVTNVSAKGMNMSIHLSWDDPIIEEPDNWKGTRVVYKTGSFPVDMQDGTSITSSVRDQYSTKNSNYLLINNVQNGVEIFISLYTFNDKGTVNNEAVAQISVSPIPPRSMLAIIDMENPSLSTNITYGEDAIDMTVGSDEWDEFFGIRPCLITPDTGEVLGYLKPNDFRQYEDGTAAPTTTNHVAMEFPKRGLDIRRIDNKVYVRITDVDPSISGVGYDPFTSLDGGIADNIYVLSYNARFDKVATATTNITAAHELCETLADGYMPFHRAHFTYIQAMLILKYRRFDIRTIFGGGPGSTQPNSGNRYNAGINGSIPSSSFSSTKIFGLEDLYSMKIITLIDGVCSFGPGTNVINLHYRPIDKTEYIDSGLKYMNTYQYDLYTFGTNIIGYGPMAFIQQDPFTGSVSTYISALARVKGTVNPLETETYYVGIAEYIDGTATGPFGCTLSRASGFMRLVYTPPTPKE